MRNCMNLKNFSDKSVYNAIISRRSIRKFKQRQIGENLLLRFVDAARLAPSGANIQPLRYFIVNDKDLCAKVFETLSWAGYITPKWTPKESERPVAYIVILVEKDAQFYKWDVGLASENIMLVAEEEGIGSCMLLKVDRKKLRDILRVPEKYLIDAVIALGYKAEESVVEEMKDSVKYFRDENNTMHVPKRRLEDIVHINEY